MWQMTQRRQVQLATAALACLLAIPRALAQDDDIHVRLYDVRDLRSILSAEVAGAPEMDLRELIDRITGTFECEAVELLEGVYTVSANREGHAKFAQMLADVRALFTERYEVTLLTYSVPAGEAPEIGAAAKVDGPDMLQRMVLARRTATPIESVTARAFVSKLMPIVAESAIAYEPTTAKAAEGISATLLVGADEEDARGTTLRITGTYTAVRLERSAGPDGAGKGATWTIDLPEIDERTIQTNLRVNFGTPTVVAVVAGGAQESIVIAASVRKLSEEKPGKP